MNATKLLIELLQSGVQLWVEDDELCYRASQSALTPDRRKQLSEHKAEIIALLAKQNTRYSSPSFSQQRMWLLQQLDPGDTSYNMGHAIRMKGVLNVEALQLALGAIAARHEALRTTFAEVDGSPVQVIAPASSMPLPVADLSRLPGAEREEVVQRRTRQEKLRPFDLERGPLFRGELLRQSEEEHVLLISMHHIVCDGWSMGVFQRELGSLYESFSRGEPSPLPELAIQYADYALWQRRWLAGDVLHEQLGYWRQQLAELPTLELPTDHPRPAVQTHLGALEKLILPATLTEALEELGRRERSTLFMVLLGAFQALLSRHSGQEDVAVGTPIAGRNQAETEGLIGFFINTLVMRTDLSDDPTFKELLRRTREVALGAYDHQDLPFERLVEELQPERDLSRTPLFQVFFNMGNVPSGRIELPGLTIETIQRSSELGEFESRFDITLYAREREGRLELRAVYNADLFEPDTISVMLGHFRTLLEGIAEDPERRLSSLSLLAATERSRLSGWGAGERTAKPSAQWAKAEIEQSIPARFERQVEMNPHNVAIKTSHHEWSYAELNTKANLVARALLGRSGAGAREAQRIALIFGHGAPMIAGLLGVLKAGKAYVPLDPSHPEERLTYMLDDAQGGAILTDEANLALATKLSEGKLPLINVDEAGLVDNRDSPIGTTDEGGPAVSPKSVAYILYTSGSTGQPKGVVQNHRNVLHFIRTYTNNLHIDTEDRLTLLSSYTFDAAVMDIFGALLNGASLCVIDLRQEVLPALAERLVGWGITIYHSTPTVYRHFVSSLGRSDEDASKQFPRLRLVVLGGEAVNRQDVESYVAHFPEECLFVNGLGPTESTVSLQYFVDRGTPLRRHAVPVGYAVEDTEILLLDQADREAEVYGEIAIRSPYLALGYWRKPELNQKAFLPDPTEGNRRIYRTGDVGRLLPDGAIEWRGRTDHQVKLRGFRVEPGEVEAVLDGYPGVCESVAVLHGEERGEPRLVAYYVVADEQTPQTNELRGYLKKRLPDYMVPSVFVGLDAIPLTPSGKVDRRALPAPDPSSFRADNVYVEPRNQREETLAGIWEEILGLERVGVHDHFFDLGGQSLQATRVISRVQEVFGVELPLLSIFEEPTLSGLANRLEEVLQSHAAPSIAVQKMDSTEELRF